MFKKLSSYITDPSLHIHSKSKTYMRDYITQTYFAPWGILRSSKKIMVMAKGCIEFYRNDKKIFKTC